MGYEIIIDTFCIEHNYLCLIKSFFIIGVSTFDIALFILIFLFVIVNLIVATTKINLKEKEKYLRGAKYSALMLLLLIILKVIFIFVRNTR